MWQPTHSRLQAEARLHSGLGNIRERVKVGASLEHYIEFHWPIGEVGSLLNVPRWNLKSDEHGQVKQSTAKSGVCGEHSAAVKYGGLACDNHQDTVSTLLPIHLLNAFSLATLFR